MNAGSASSTPTPADAPTVYRPKDAFRVRTRSVGCGLLVVCTVMIIGGIGTHSVSALLGAGAVLVLAVWTLAEFRKHVTITADELVVQGRLTQTRVNLADITAVHHQKTSTRVDDRRLVVWIAARGQRPFRIYFLVGHQTFVTDLRRRAAARGAQIDIDSPNLEEAPHGTRVLFTLL